VPQPVASSLVVATVERDRAEALLLELHRSSLLPVACLAVRGEAGEAIAVPHGQLALVARFEGNDAVVRAQATDAVRLWGGEEWPAERASVAWAGVAVSLEGRPGGVSLRIASLPVDGLRVLECLENCSAWARGGSCVVQFGAGIASAHLPGDTASSELAALRARLAAHEARLTLLGAPGRLQAHPEADAVALDMVALDLVQRTKQTFDPHGILPPYNGVGGWH